jgi:hypothetical protein
VNEELTALTALTALIEPGRIAPVGITAGQVVGHGRAARVVLSPAAALLDDLKRLVASDPLTYPGRRAVERQRRYEQGKLAGQIEGVAKALAYLLAGHDHVYGNGWEAIVTAVREAVRAIPVEV